MTDPLPTTPHPMQGEGFVMWFDGKPVEQEKAIPAQPHRETWPGIEEDVRELERLLWPVTG